MKKSILILLGGLATLSSSLAQDSSAARAVSPQGGSPVTGETVQPVVATDQDAPKDPAADIPADIPAAGGAEPAGDAPKDMPVDQPEAAPGAPVVAPPAEKKAIEEDEGGFLIKNASINDIFQLLARRAGKQYFHNNQLNTEDYQVTGHLNGDTCLLYTSPSPRDQRGSRMPSSA